MDVGVAGLHRLLDQLPRLESAAVLIACAGMEGALPTVLAGLVPQPIIAVPVSVGYGIGAGGRTALEGMLASCAPGLTVVNIDNGYGAAMAALRILRGRRSAGPADADLSKTLQFSEVVFCFPAAGRSTAHSNRIATVPHPVAIPSRVDQEP